ncbi:MAG: response regulator, partial [Methanobacterium sp.]|nr:response regulator [Methanobacterium sp.]
DHHQQERGRHHCPDYLAQREKKRERGNNMIAVTVDDEVLMLEMLTDAVAASREIAEVHDFTNGEDTLEWMKTHGADVAFLDINLRGIGGIELAKEIHRLQPECGIIFCTGYEEYALQAFGVQALGYLLKPVTEEAVQKEIDHVLELKGVKPMLKVQCFGEFEVFGRGKPLHFKRRKTKELLALLVDRRGSGLTNPEICAILWEDDAKYNTTAYLNNLFSDLRSTLEENGIPDVLVKNGNTYAVNVKMIDCDYYRYLRGQYMEQCREEYMSQYSWAETTNGIIASESRR